MENKKLSNSYWIKIVIVFTLGWIAIYATRTILNPIMTNIQSEFAINATQLGLLSSLFFLGYTVTQIPSGYLGDKFGRKKMIIPAFIGFGVLAIISGQMVTFYMFLMMWFLTGTFQGVFYGPQYGLSSEAIPQKRLTLGSAIINSGMAIGMSAGYWISSITVQEMDMSWRTPFWIMGVIVIVIGIIMWIMVKEHPPGYQAPTSESGAPEKLKVSELFKNRNLILAFITIFCSIYGFFVILTWLPYYLETARGISGSSVAFVSSLVPWASIPGMLFFGWLSDKLGKQRPVLLVMVPLAFLSTISIVLFDQMWVLYVSLIVYGIVGKLSTNPVLIAVVANNAPRVGLATSFGIYNFIGMSASILAPYITGFITDVTGNLDMGFYLAGGLLVVGIIAVFLLDESGYKRVEHVEKVN
jgi:Sugar phosphate permease